MTLPNFVIIGAYKSGTTSLYNYLSGHPDVFMSRVKEPNFFAKELKSSMMAEEGRKGGIIDSMEAYTALFDQVTNEPSVGEASPIYLHTPQAAERIAATLPNVKLIAILRHPVDAFYSDHYMRVREGRKLTQNFEDRMEALRIRIEAGETAGPLYFKNLQPYFQNFEAQNIKVYLYEDLKTDALALIKDIYRFLDIDDSFIPDMSAVHNVGRIPRIPKLNHFLRKQQRKPKIRKNPLLKRTLSLLQNITTSSVPPLSRERRRELTKIFEEDILKLGGVINRDMSSWLE